MPIFDNDPNEGKPLASGLAPGQFRMWRVGYTIESDPWAVWALLGPNARPKVIRGTGGWGQIAREGRRGVSTVAGMETPAYSVTLRLDQKRPELASVKDQMRNLEKLAGWNLADDTPPPPVYWIANVAHDHAEAPRTEWGIETALDWGDSIASDRGTLLWQDVTFVLGALRVPELPTLGRAKGFATKDLPAGRDLRWFARRYLDDASRWKDVAALNRDNPRCPGTSDYKVKKNVEDLLLPPREAKATRGRR